jgi:hypothetical protein
MTLFDRLRRASALRIVLIAATLMASQSSLACAFEAAVGNQGTEAIASMDSGSVGAEAPSSDDSDGGCCSFCLDCAHCGGCHSSVLNLRSQSGLALALIVETRAQLDDVAPALWTPSTLLRPPIHAA